MIAATLANKSGAVKGRQAQEENNGKNEIIKDWRKRCHATDGDNDPGQHPLMNLMLTDEEKKGLEVLWRNQRNQIEFLDKSTKPGLGTRNANDADRDLPPLPDVITKATLAACKGSNIESNFRRPDGFIQISRKAFPAKGEQSSLKYFSDNIRWQVYENSKDKFTLEELQAAARCLQRVRSVMVKMANAQHAVTANNALSFFREEPEFSEIRNNVENLTAIRKFRNTMEEPTPEFINLVGKVSQSLDEPTKQLGVAKITVELGIWCSAQYHEKDYFEDNTRGGFSLVKHYGVKVFNDQWRNRIKRPICQGKNGWKIRETKVDGRIVFEKEQCPTAKTATAKMDKDHSSETVSFSVTKQVFLFCGSDHLLAFVSSLGFVKEFGI